MPGYVAGITKYEQENKLETIFQSLGRGFKALDGLSDAKQQASLKELTAQMQEAKTLIKEFEREARTDGMPPMDLATRKKLLVQELNGYITAKKDFTTAAATKAELTAGATVTVPKGGVAPKTQQDMSSSQLMELGRKEIKETDEALGRAQRLVQATIEVGTKTAETLQGQTEQMERVVNDLDEVKFTLKKASKVMRDITRSMATDKCIMALMVAAVVAVCVLIGVKAAGLEKKAPSIPIPHLFGSSPSATPSPAATSPPSPAATTGRRLLYLTRALQQALDLT